MIIDCYLMVANNWGSSSLGITLLDTNLMMRVVEVFNWHWLLLKLKNIRDNIIILIYVYIYIHLH